MLDEKDLQAIAMLIKSEIAESEKRMDKKLEAQEGRIMHNMKVLLDTEVTTKFNLIAEDLQILHEKVDAIHEIKVDQAGMSNRIVALETAVRKLNREVQELKKAN